MSLACRICRVSLYALEGCDVCDPLRRQLVVVGEDDEDRPSLSGTASEAVSVLRAQLRHLKGVLTADPDDANAARRAVNVTNAVSKVLESARKLQADGIAALENYSFQEKKELFVTWYGQLAPAYRNAVREAFAEHEAEIARPLEPETARVDN